MTAGRRLAWIEPGDPADAFPDIETAFDEPDGLLAAGGDLEVARLLAAYRRGIFPWYEETQPILWWSPDPRCILRPGEIRVSRRLRQYARHSTLQLTFNRAFGEVIRACAGRRPRKAPGTWITPDMIAAYESMHRAGWAHSIEVRRDGALVGGLYGIAIGKAFFGESMYSAVDNASKFALLGLASVMLSEGLELLDCQMVTAHLVGLGATTVSRRDFRSSLDALCEPAIRFEGWPRGAIPVSGALESWREAALQ